jgi:hypothetical protein
MVTLAIWQVVCIVITVVTFIAVLFAPGSPQNSSIGRFFFGMIWIVCMIIMWLAANLMFPSAP